MVDLGSAGSRIAHVVRFVLRCLWHSDPLRIVSIWVVDVHLPGPGHILCGEPAGQRVQIPRPQVVVPGLPVVVLPTVAERVAVQRLRLILDAKGIFFVEDGILLLTIPICLIFQTIKFFFRKIFVSDPDQPFGRNVLHQVWF